jgi:hypothetical protein
MKTTSVLAALVLTVAASGAAQAQEATYEYPQPAVSAKTRADVQAELFAARADGSAKAWSTTYNPLALARSQKSREQVRAERLADPTWTYVGEDSGSFALSRPQPARAAAPVFALRAQ